MRSAWRCRLFVSRHHRATSTMRVSFFFLATLFTDTITESLMLTLSPRHCATVLPVLATYRPTSRPHGHLPSSWPPPSLPPSPPPPPPPGPPPPAAPPTPRTIPP